MASTKADNNRVVWTYTDSSNPTVDYAISAKSVYVKDVTDGAKFGGSAALQTARRIPKDIKPRRVKCVAEGKPDKWIVCYSEDATLWTTPGTAVTLDCNGVDTAYVSTAKKREEKYRDTTRQTA